MTCPFKKLTADDILINLFNQQAATNLLEWVDYYLDYLLVFEEDFTQKEMIQIVEALEHYMHLGHSRKFLE